MSSTSISTLGSSSASSEQDLNSTSSSSTSSDQGLDPRSQALVITTNPPSTRISVDSERTPSVDPFHALRPISDDSSSRDTSPTPSETGSKDDVKENPVPYAHSIISAEQLRIFCLNVNLPTKYEARPALLSERACDSPQGTQLFI
jgi:hypothetical protein